MVKKDTLTGLYGTMVKIRLFEERVIDLYARGLIPGLAHLYIGEEAIAAGVCAALGEKDYITSTHRGHGHVIAKGANLKPMMAELFGKKTGYCKGKGGSMHIADMEIGILGANGIAGGGIPIAVGSGMSAKWRGTDQVTACFFGDDASNNGVFHESLNMAALYGLPVIFVCENNLYGISVGQKKQRLIDDIGIRATSYNIPGVTVDGNDVVEVYEASIRAVKRARAGEGPSLIECKTYRWRGHHEGDPNQGRRYRTTEEIETWKEKDPIKRMADKLIIDKLLTQKKMGDLRNQILEEIEAAVAFANESEFPAIEALYEDVYIEGAATK
jgi:acetoin:2,6-dichlorophenolindophenol oxidoreductase subunit alpha